MSDDLDGRIEFIAAGIRCEQGSRVTCLHADVALSPGIEWSLRCVDGMSFVSDLSR